MLCLPAQESALSQSLPNANYQQTDNNLGILFAKKIKIRFRALLSCLQCVAGCAECSQQFRDPRASATGYRVEARISVQTADLWGPACWRMRWINNIDDE
jgi:hypothetical protein